MISLTCGIKINTNKHIYKNIYIIRDIEKRSVVAKEESQAGKDCEFGISKRKLLYIQDG